MPQKNRIKKIEGSYVLSLYKSGQITEKGKQNAIIKLKAAFPALPTGFYAVLFDRLKEHGFSDRKMYDAINHVIDTCVYPTPTIAQFIIYDKNIRIYTYNEILKMLNEDKKVFESYVSVRIYSNQKKPVYVHINDFERFKLEKWNAKK